MIITKFTLCHYYEMNPRKIEQKHNGNNLKLKTEQNNVLQHHTEYST